MKKSLLALSVLSVFAGTAYAQSNVTIYGVVDAGINYSDTGAASDSTKWGMANGGQSGNRIGFRGVEDLGGGMKALFTLEQGFNVNNGTQAEADKQFSRQAFVGLSGAPGTVTMGRQYNPIRSALESVSPFEIGLAGNILNIFNAQGERADNTIKYATPNMGGFSGQASYSLSSTPDDSSRGRQYGASAGYANGPVLVVLSYQNANTVSSAGADTGDAKTIMIGGTYNFGVVKAHAAYALNKGDSEVGVEKLDSKDMMVGVSVPVGGAGKFLASYMSKSNDLTANADSDMWSIGYTHALSKRTNLYTSYAMMANDSATKLKIKGLEGTPGNGNDPSVFNIGIRHKF